MSDGIDDGDDTPIEGGDDAPAAAPSAPLGLDLTGETALVTGSAQGVGRAIVLALADAGADVAVTYRTSAAPAQAVVETARERGVDATRVECDVTDEDSVDEAFDAVEATLGPPTVLVNNVGSFAPERWDEQSVDSWRAVLETNLIGTMLCSRRAVPAMRERGWGRIVNVGYADAEMGLVSPVNFPYFVAKAGVARFTRMLAADLTDEGINVNAVAPYVVENSDVFPPELPRGEPATFADIVAPVCFFCHDAASYVSGETLPVDAGWLPERNV